MWLALPFAIWLAQELTPAERRRRDYPEAFELAERAQGVPAELRAQALIRVAGLASIRDTAWKVELLEQAFEAALLAHLPSQVDYVPPPDGPAPEGMYPRVERAHSINRGLDRLTLARNAIRTMLPLDRDRARRMFERVPLPEMRTFRCADPLLPDTSRYFETGGLFKDPEVSAQALRKVTSALQMRAAANLVAAAPSPELTQSYAALLTSVAVENRAWANEIEEFSEAMAKLYAAAAEPDRPALLAGWRSYLSRGLRAPACAEAVAPDLKWKASIQKAFDAKAVAAGADPLGTIENTNAALGACEDPQSGAASKAKEIGREGLALLTASDSKKDADWQARFRRYLNAIEDVKKDDVPDEDLTLFKAGAFSLAATAAPQGPLQDFTTARFLDQLKIANVPSAQLAPWYAALTDWIGLMQTLGVPESKVLAMLEESGQHMLWVVARGQQLTGQK